ncbi:hypothetical protein L228DRAFT_262996 [Xylona heveae TC161]|uniref:Telomeric single stranded DNA binding POT1/Cdc13 domain-containing protein n=1 Tax=Xylona heveae (strain CBS 132557 / TC161) TaxID=1328760 RepID=A0A165AEA4_XYLHT|nr:hypothetical protein L228DRAFT_262996 [Xylona heveae TC161]KZF20335.1 hypothetical protein L228DRAFT_262996 [Xylona heveae TC161]
MSFQNGSDGRTRTISPDASTLVRIAELKPGLKIPLQSSIKAVVSLIWPYSSSSRTISVLLAEPDFRLRRDGGQIRVQFSEPCARAVAGSGIETGDEVILSLVGAEWTNVADGITLPGKSVEGELRFNNDLLLGVHRDDKKIASLEIHQPPIDSSSPPQSPSVRIPETPHTPGPTRVLSGRPPSPSNTWSSPAFLKRSRTSYEASPDPIAKLFLEDEDYVNVRSAKRARFLRGSGQWRLSSNSPRPAEPPEATQMSRENTELEDGMLFPASEPRGLEVDSLSVAVPEAQAVEGLLQTEEQKRLESSDLAGDKSRAPSISAAQTTAKSDVLPTFAPQIAITDRKSPQPQVPDSSHVNEGFDMVGLEKHQAVQLSDHSKPPHRGGQPSQSTNEHLTARNDAAARDNKSLQASPPDAQFIGEPRNIEVSASIMSNITEPQDQQADVQAESNGVQPQPIGSGLKQSDSFTADLPQSMPSMQTLSAHNTQLEEVNHYESLRDKPRSSSQEEHDDRFHEAIKEASGPVQQDSIAKSKAVEMAGEISDHRNEDSLHLQSPVRAEFGLNQVETRVQQKDISSAPYAPEAINEAPDSARPESMAMSVSKDSGNGQRFKEHVEAPESAQVSPPASQKPSQEHIDPALNDAFLHPPAIPLRPSNDSQEQNLDASQLATPPATQKSQKEADQASSLVVQDRSLSQRDQSSGSDFTQPNHLLSPASPVSISRQPEDSAKDLEVATGGMLEEMKPLSPLRETSAEAPTGETTRSMALEKDKVQHTAEASAEMDVEHKGQALEVASVNDKSSRQILPQEATRALPTMADSVAEPSGFRTQYSYFAPLSTIGSQFGCELDVIAIVTSITTIKRAKSGQKDFHLFLRLSDPSFFPSSIAVQLFRPFKAALPLAALGDAVLLRNVKVQSQNRKPVLVSGPTSAWVVFKDETGEANGPPVEYGSQEEDFAKGLEKWWNDLAKHIKQLMTANRSD